MGFLFCKVMSIHWALLDNFYVLPSARGNGVGAALLDSLKQILIEREIKYLSALFREQDAETPSFFQKFGFQRQMEYLWMDVFLENLGKKRGYQSSCADSRVLPVRGIR